MVQPAVFKPEPHWGTMACALTNKRILVAKGLIDIKNAKKKIRRENRKQFFNVNAFCFHYRLSFRNLCLLSQACP